VSGVNVTVIIQMQNLKMQSMPVIRTMREGQSEWGLNVEATRKERGYDNFD
jgi:hypothetical protein